MIDQAQVLVCDPAWLFQVEVVRTLLSEGINVDLKDQDNRTVLQVMEEVKTPVGREVSRIIKGREDGSTGEEGVTSQTSKYRSTTLVYILLSTRYRYCTVEYYFLSQRYKIQNIERSM